MAALAFYAVGLAVSIPLGFAALFQAPVRLAGLCLTLAALFGASELLWSRFGARLGWGKPRFMASAWLSYGAFFFAAALLLAWRACAEGPADGFCFFAGVPLLPFSVCSLAVGLLRLLARR